MFGADPFGDQEMSKPVSAFIKLAVCERIISHITATASGSFAACFQTNGQR
ncbi:hypothetical protein PO124_27075 [Bacillus licheniformis]|nr:hypothetical protein [Bacillus licheniformis]